MSAILVMGKVFVVMLCYRPIQRLSDDRSINLNLSDHMRFSRENMMLAVCKNRKNEACLVLFVTTLNTNYRDMWREQ